MHAIYTFKCTHIHTYSVYTYTLTHIHIHPRQSKPLADTTRKPTALRPFFHEWVILL